MILQPLFSSPRRDDYATSMEDAIRQLSSGKRITSGVLSSSPSLSSSSRIQALTASRMTAVTELESVYDALRAAFRNDSSSVFDNDRDVNLTSLVAVLDRNINAVIAQRAAIGAMTNGLEAQVSALATRATNLQSANSRILDTDYALATAELTRGQILQQAFASVANIQSNLSGRMIETLLS